MALGNQNLTHTSREQQMTAPGMAHFAGTGPRGETCGRCAFLKTKTDVFASGRCEKYRKLTSKVGPEIKANLAACKYFEPCRSTT